MPAITVEFFGIPRRRAGRELLTLEAATVADALTCVRAVCPGLGDLLDGEDRLNPHYLLSLNGVVFGPDLSHPLHDGDRLLLLSADAGG